MRITWLQEYNRRNHHRYELLKPGNAMRALKLLLCLLILSCPPVLHAQMDTGARVLSPVTTIISKNFISSISLCPDASCFVADIWSNVSRFFVIYDVATGKEIGTLESPGKRDVYAGGSFIPDTGRFIGWRNGVALWDFASRSLLMTVDDCDDYVLHVRLNRAGTSLLRYCHNDDTEIWDIASGKMLLSLPGAMDWLYDERYIARYDEGQPNVDIHDAITGEKIATLPTESGVVVIMPGTKSNQLLVSTDVISLWDMDTRTKLHTFPYDGESIWLPDWNEIDHHLTFPDIHEITMWDNISGAKLLAFALPDTARAYGIRDWNEDETLMMVGFRMPEDCDENCTYGTMVWDASGKLVQSFTGHDFDYSAWRPGHPTQRMYWRNNTDLVIQDVLTGESLYVLPHPVGSYSLHYFENDGIYSSADGNRIITYIADKVYVWDIPAD